MRALLLQGREQAGLAELPVPMPGNGERLVRVTACGLCRTDAKMWAHGQRDLVLPRVLGHEICGIEVESGNRVVVWPGVPCRHCLACSQRQYHRCPSIQIVGFNRDGGLAEFVVAPARSLIEIPGELPAGLATLAEPLACAIHAVQSLELVHGKRVLILGGGVMGLLLAYLFHGMGVESVVIVEPDLRRHEQGRPFLDVLRAAWQSPRFARTQVEMQVEPPAAGAFDILVNATAAPDALVAGLRCVVSGGQVSLFSGLPAAGAMALPALNEIHYRELRVLGSYGCPPADMRQAVKLLGWQSRLLANLISGTLPLENAEQGLRHIIAGNGLKWIVTL